LPAVTRPVQKSRNCRQPSIVGVAKSELEYNNALSNALLRSAYCDLVDSQMATSCYEHTPATSSTGCLRPDADESFIRTRIPHTALNMYCILAEFRSQSPQWLDSKSCISCKRRLQPCRMRLSGCSIPVPGLLCGPQNGYSNQQEEKGVSRVLSSCPVFVKTMYAHQ